MTIVLPAGVSLASGGLRLLLRFAQARTGAAPWGGALAEEFRGPRGTLLIIRPAVTAEVAPYAQTFIHKFLNL